VWNAIALWAILVAIRSLPPREKNAKTEITPLPEPIFLIPSVNTLSRTHRSCFLYQGKLKTKCGGVSLWKGLKMRWVYNNLVWCAELYIYFAVCRPSSVWQLLRQPLSDNQFSTPFISTTTSATYIFYCRFGISGCYLSRNLMVANYFLVVVALRSKERF
jgi:hypothetical protein